MKTTTVTTYTCEVCGAQYLSRLAAEACENYKMPYQLNLVVGQKVVVQTRYDGPQDAIVTKAPFITSRCGWVFSEYTDEHMRDVLHRHPFYFHRWSIEIDRELQIGKQWRTTTIPQNHLPSYPEPD